MHRTRLLFSFLALAGLVAGLLPGTLGAREVIPAEQTPAGDVVIRLYYDNRAQLDAVAGELDIWEVHSQEGYVVAAVTPALYQWLEGQGYRLEIDQEKTDGLGIMAPLDPQYYYYDNYYPNSNNRYWVNFLQDVNTNYPGITELIDIGDAWGGLHGLYHRDMWVLRVTNEDPAFGAIADKPPFMIAPQAHAREVTTPEMAIRYIKYLTSGYSGQGGYGIDPDVTWLVDWNAAYIMVGMNPDGHVVNEQNTGANWRKNIDNDDGCPTGNYGTDLNRNFAFRWGCCGGSSGNCASDTYRGPSRASEPEVSAVQAYFATVFQDWNGNNGDDEIPPAAPENTKGIFLSVHTYSDLVLWPWGFQTTDAPNAAQLMKLGCKEAYYLRLLGGNYVPEQSRDLYVTDGSSDDWTYGKFGIPSFTFEMGPQSGSCGGFFPAFNCQEGTGGAPRNFWGEFRPTAIYMHKVARTPYVTAYGPDSQNLAVSPNPVSQGDPVALSALIQDHRYYGDPHNYCPNTLANIASAEYFVDEPGADGTGTAMAPQDGSWGGASETAIATVDTSGLSVGRHYILVHGKSATDNRWGPFTAIFLTVDPPGGCDAVVIENVTAQVDGCSATFSAEISGTAPFTYDWDFGAFGSSAEPTPTVDFGVPGTYPYTLTVNNCGGAGQDTFQGEVTVDCCVPPSDAAFAYAPLDPVSGETVVFTGTASGSEPLTYEWDFGDGTTGSGAIISHTYDAGGDYTVVMTASNGCGVQVVQQTITVCGLVQNPAFTWSPALPPVGVSVAFHGTAEGSTPIAYAWDLGDGSSAAGQDVTHTYSAAGDFTVVMTASNCGTGGAQVSNVVTVVAPVIGVSPVPTMTLYPTHTAQWIMVISNTGDYTLNWSLAENPPVGWLQEAPTSGQVSPGGRSDVTLDYTAPANPGTYSTVLRVSSDDPLNPQVDVDVVLHVVPEPPVCYPVTGTDFDWTPPSPYVGDVVNFTGTTSGTEPIQFTWAFGDGGAGSGANTSHSYSAAGTYTVTLTAENCDGATDTATHTLVVQELPVCEPVQVISVTQQVNSCIVTFGAQLSGDSPFAYLWDFGDGVTSTLPMPAHTYTATGTYSGTLDVWNCDDAGHDTFPFTVQVDCTVPRHWYVYLPVVFK